MKEWLDSHSIFYWEDAMKTELYEIIKSNPKLITSVPSANWGGIGPMEKKPGGYKM
jgi:hypothetical protein